MAYEDIKVAAARADLVAFPDWPRGVVVDSPAGLVLADDGSAISLTVDGAGDLRCNTGSPDAVGEGLLTSLAGADGTLPASDFRRSRLRLNLSAGVDVCESPEAIAELRKWGLLARGTAVSMPSLADILLAQIGVEPSVATRLPPSVEFKIGDRMVVVDFEHDGTAKVHDERVPAPTRLGRAAVPAIVGHIVVGRRLSALGTRAARTLLDRVDTELYSMLATEFRDPGEILRALTRLVSPPEPAGTAAAEDEELDPELAVARLASRTERYLAAARSGWRAPDRRRWLGLRAARPRKACWRRLKDLGGFELSPGRWIVRGRRAAMVIQVDDDEWFGEGWLAVVRQGREPEQLPKVESFRLAVTDVHALALGTEAVLYSDPRVLGAPRDWLYSALAGPHDTPGDDVFGRQQCVTGSISRWRGGTRSRPRLRSPRRPSPEALMDGLNAAEEQLEHMFGRPVG